MTISRLLLIIPICLSAISLTAQHDHSILDLKRGKFVEDSSYIYALPFATGKKVWLVQGYESMFSHKGERSLDFKVRKGTAIHAAREGIVISTRDDSKNGGLKAANMNDGNFISIQHEDGTVANYWHLNFEGVKVKAGDTVQKGQWIGMSGNTGYSAFPHLHFEVLGHGSSGEFKQIATRFQTQKGIRYLRPGRFYKRRS